MQELARYVEDELPYREAGRNLDEVVALREEQEVINIYYICGKYIY